MILDEWARQYGMLCKRYRRKIDNDECVSYYEHFGHFRYDLVVTALKGVKKESRYFPTPLEIENAYNVAHDNDGREKRERVQCDHCGSTGFIFFSTIKSPYPYTQPCAHCTTRSIMKQVISKPDGSIWWAYFEEGKNKDGNPIYEANMGRLVEVVGGCIDG